MATTTNSLSIVKKRDIIIATRSSQLALWQANYISSLLWQNNQRSQIETFKTTGDRIQNRPLHEIGGKGLFIREIEKALVDKNADIAVHSLKDMPAKIKYPFKIAAIPPRGPAWDVLLFRPGYSPQQPTPDCLSRQMASELPDITIATGSLRRRALLNNAAPQIDVTPIRGNVDSRIARLREGEWDGLILAKAALSRLVAAEDLSQVKLDPNWFIPSPGQGAVAVETLANYPHLPCFDGLNDPCSSFHVKIERRILEYLGADCTLPVGIHCFQENLNDVAIIKVNAVVLTPNGEMVSTTYFENQSSRNTTEAIAQKVITKLIERGVNQILEKLGLPMI